MCLHDVCKARISGLNETCEKHGEEAGRDEKTWVEIVKREFQVRRGEIEVEERVCVESGYVFGVHVRPRAARYGD